MAGEQMKRKKKRFKFYQIQANHGARLGRGWFPSESHFLLIVDSASLPFLPEINFHLSLNCLGK